MDDCSWAGKPSGYVTSRLHCVSKKRANFETVQLEIIRIIFHDIWQKYSKKLWSRVCMFQFSWKSVLTVLSYTLSKFARFFETQCGSTQPTTLKTFGGDNKQHYATDVGQCTGFMRTQNSWLLGFCIGTCESALCIQIESRIEILELSWPYIPRNTFHNGPTEYELNRAFTNQ